MSQLYAPSALTKGIRPMLLRAMSGLESQDYSSMLATTITSSSNNEVYQWLGESPRMRTLLDDDEIIFDSMSDTSYTLTNNTYASGIAINRRTFDDSQTEGIRLRIQQLAQVAVAHKNRLLIDMLINGDVTTTGNDYTGETFFNNTHTARGQQTATWDNIMAGAGVTVANVLADLNDSLELMLSYLAENNEPFNETINEITVVFPTTLRRQMVEATKAAVIAQTTNVSLSDLRVNLLPTARLNADDANDWFILNTGGAVKPLLVQIRDNVEITVVTDPEADSVIRREQYLVKARWRGVTGYAHPQNAVKVTNS